VHYSLPDDIVLWSVSQPTSWVDLDASRRDFLVARNAIQCRTFAASIRTEQAKDLSGVCLQVDAFDCMHVLATLEDPGEEPWIVSRGLSVLHCQAEKKWCQHTSL
jgi:hypothetical protein